MNVCIVGAFFAQNILRFKNKFSWQMSVCVLLMAERDRAEVGPRWAIYRDEREEGDKDISDIRSRECGE